MDKLNLALLDHTEDSIRDQIFFLKLTCESLGIELKIQHNIDKHLKNVIFEGHVSEKYCDDLEYIRQNPSQFSMVLTEHLDQTPEGEYLLNGAPVVSEFSPEIDPYIFPAKRFHALTNISHEIPLFLTCGELPAVDTYNSIFPNSSFAQLPWPPCSIESRKPSGKGLVFSIPNRQLLTPFRLEVLKEISRQGCSVKILHSKSITKTLEYYAKYSAVLDVPKTAQWKYDSPMRSFLSIIANRPRVNIRGSKRASPISAICDIRFKQYVSFTETDLSIFVGQMRSRFETFIKAQNSQPLIDFAKWLRL